MGLVGPSRALLQLHPRKEYRHDFSRLSLEIGMRSKFPYQSWHGYEQVLKITQAFRKFTSPCQNIPGH
jgi:hypothetical protein